MADKDTSSTYPLTNSLAGTLAGAPSIEVSTGKQFLALPNDRYLHEQMMRITPSRQYPQDNGDLLIIHRSEHDTPNGEGAILYLGSDIRIQLPTLSDFTYPARQVLCELIAEGMMRGWPHHIIYLQVRYHLAMLDIAPGTEAASDELKRLRIALRELNSWRLPMHKIINGKIHDFAVEGIGSFDFDNRSEVFGGAFSRTYYEYLKHQSKSLIYIPSSWLTMRGRHKGRPLRLIYNLSVHKSVEPIYIGEPLIDIRLPHSMLLAMGDIPTYEHETKKGRKSEPRKHINVPFFDTINNHVMPDMDVVIIEKGASDAYTVDQIRSKISPAELWNPNSPMRVVTRWINHPDAEADSETDESGGAFRKRETKALPGYMTDKLLGNIKEAFARGRLDFEKRSAAQCEERERRKLEQRRRREEKKKTGNNGE